MNKSLILKHVLIFCVLLSGFPILFSELLIYLSKDLLIFGALLYIVTMIVTAATCIGIGIFFAARLSKRKVYSISTLPISLLVLGSSYTFTYLSYNYRPLLSPLRFELLLAAAAFIIPACIMILAFAVVRRTQSSRNAMVICLLLLVVGSAILFGVSKSFTYTYQESQLLGRIRQADYSYFLPHSNVMNPNRIQLYTGDVDFKEGVSLSIKNGSSVKDDTMPTYVTIDERPRHISDISAACGTEIKTTYLSDTAQADSYTCVQIASSANGPIYEVSYDVPIFTENPHVKEYVLIAKRSYVYATYQSLSLTQPRIYDQKASVTLLQSVAPVTPEVFFDRLMPLQLKR